MKVGYAVQWSCEYKKGVLKMRDIQRIEPFMNEIASIWKEKCPDSRFGQFMVGYFYAVGDPFYYEEEEFLLGLKAFVNGEDPKEAIKKWRESKQV